MEEQNNQVNKDKIKEATVESIDDFNDAIKKSTERFIKACIESGVQILHNAVDNCSNKVKQKIKGDG